MEDGAFLGRVLAEVVRGILTLEQAIHVYEKTRMPRAWMKQQASFTMGAMYMLPAPLDKYREAASTSSVEQTEAMNEVANLRNGVKEVTGPDPNSLSWNLWGAPETVQSIFGYDPEGDADHAVLTYLSETTRMDENTGMSEGLEKKWVGWFTPKEHVGRITHAKGSKL